MSALKTQKRTGRPAPELIFGDLWEFDPAPETADPKLKPRYDLFIDGRFVAPRGGEMFDSINPANEKKLAEIGLASVADVDAACQAAARASRPGRSCREPSAASTSTASPACCRTARASCRRRDARWRQTDQGVARLRRADGRGALLLPRGLGRQAGLRLPGCDGRAPRRGGAGDSLEFPPAHARVETRAGAGHRQHGRAEAGGNDVHHGAQVRRDRPGSGTAPGVVNIVAGAGETGAALLAHPLAAKIAFTGSTEVGKLIVRSLAGSGKKMTLELGGKAANIVFDDAPLDQAVEGIVNGIFFNQGHVCCAGSRLLVQEGVAATVLAKLKRRIQVLRVGDPMDKNTDIGAINSKAQLDKIRDLVDSGVKEGAELYQPACKLPAKGWYFRPTLFSGVQQSHRIAREEIFGPVLSIMTFRTVDEAVEKANNTAYGLSAGVWTTRARVS